MFQITAFNVSFQGFMMHRILVESPVKEKPMITRPANIPRKALLYYLIGILPTVKYITCVFPQVIERVLLLYESKRCFPVFAMSLKDLRRNLHCRSCYNCRCHPKQQSTLDSFHFIHLLLGSV